MEESKVTELMNKISKGLDRDGKPCRIVSNTLIRFENDAPLVNAAYTRYFIDDAGLSNKGVTMRCDTLAMPEFWFEFNLNSVLAGCSSFPYLRRKQREQKGEYPSWKGHRVRYRY
jgi:hypothetical protein